MPEPIKNGQYNPTNSFWNTKLNNKEELFEPGNNKKIDISSTKTVEWHLKSWGWYFFVMAVIVFVMIPAVWHLVSNAFYITQSFFWFWDKAIDSTNDIWIDKLKDVFLILLAIIAAMITLFTPSKKIKSPLNYFAEDFQKKASKIKGQQDPEVKKQAIVATAITSIVLLILMASYFFIIRNIVSVNDGQVDWTIFSVLLKLVVIALFLAYTSFIVNKFLEIDSATWNTEEQETKRNMWTIALIVWVISVIWIGNGLSDYVNKQIDTDNNLKRIKEILGWDSWDWKLWDDTINVIE